MAQDTAEAGARESSPLVLVAEDEESVRSMVALVLRSRGYRALLCADGREALDQVDAGAEVDAALVDVRMPRLGGIELVAELRRREALEGLPIIAMSAYNDDLQEREVLTAGADAFLPKPFTVQQLVSALSSLLQDAS